MEGIFNYTETGTIESWKKQVNKMVNFSDNKIFLALTEMPESEDPSLVEQHAMYAFASFLMGKGKYAYFEFCMREL